MSDQGQPCTGVTKQWVGRHLLFSLQAQHPCRRSCGTGKARRTKTTRTAGDLVRCQDCSLQHSAFCQFLTHVTEERLAPTLAPLRLACILWTDVGILYGAQHNVSRIQVPGPHGHKFLSTERQSHSLCEVIGFSCGLPEYCRLPGCYAA